jgi:hypothetical protein
MLNASLVLQKLADRKRVEQIPKRKRTLHLKKQHMIHEEGYYCNNFKAKLEFQIISKIMNSSILMLQVLQFLFFFISKIIPIKLCFSHNKKHVKKYNIYNKKTRQNNVNILEKDIRKHFVFDGIQGIESYIYKNIKNMVNNINKFKNKNNYNNKNKFKIKSEKNNPIQIDKIDIKDESKSIIIKMTCNDNFQINEIVVAIKKVISIVRNKIMKMQTNSFITLKIISLPSYIRMNLNFSIINIEKYCCLHFKTKL